MYFLYIWRQCNIALGMVGKTRDDAFLIFLQKRKYTILSISYFTLENLLLRIMLLRIWTSAALGFHNQALG